MPRGGKRAGAGRPRESGRSRASGATEIRVLLVPAELDDLDRSLQPDETRAAGLRRRAGLTRSEGDTP